VHESESGQWETKLIPFWFAEDDTSEARVKLKMCSTFKPNMTLNPDTVDHAELEISLDTSGVYDARNM
jgi:hypothetical protein